MATFAAVKSFARASVELVQHIKFIVTHILNMSTKLSCAKVSCFIFLLQRRLDVAWRGVVWRFFVIAPALILHFYGMRNARNFKVFVFLLRPLSPVATLLLSTLPDYFVLALQH